VFTEWPRGDAAVKALEEFLDAHPDVDFVGIDILAMVKGAENGSGGVYQSDYEALKPYAAMAHKRNIAIVILHHLRKADGDYPIDLVSGTLGLTGAADQIIVITGNKDIGHKLTTRGRELADVSWDMQFDGGRWTILGDSAPKKRVLDKVDRIDRDNRIRQLRGQGMSIREICKATGESKGTVERAINQENGRPN
jgi:hypothetical protein